MRATAGDIVMIQAEQINDVRERLARIEVRQEERDRRIEQRLDEIGKRMDEHNRVDKKNGNVVIPVAVVVGAIEVLRQALLYLQG